MGPKSHQKENIGGNSTYIIVVYLLSPIMPQNLEKSLTADVEIKASLNLSKNHAKTSHSTQKKIFWKFYLYMGLHNFRLQLGHNYPLSLKDEFSGYFF